MIGRLMYERDVQRLREDLEEGVKLAESLGLDVSGRRAARLVLTARLMDGKALAERIRGEVAEEVRELGELGLATVLVGDDPASDIYIRLKHKAAGEVGINARRHPARVPDDRGGAARSGRAS